MNDPFKEAKRAISDREHKRNEAADQLNRLMQSEETRLRSIATGLLGRSELIGFEVRVTRGNPVTASTAEFDGETICPYISVGAVKTRLHPGGYPVGGRSFHSGVYYGGKYTAKTDDEILRSIAFHIEEIRPLPLYTGKLPGRKENSGCLSVILLVAILPGALLYFMRA